MYLGDSNHQAAIRLLGAGQISLGVVSVGALVCWRLFGLIMN